MSLSIRAMCAGWLVGSPKPTATYMRNWHDTHDAPVIMFAVTGGGSPVIVDTGPGDPDFVRRHHGYRMEQSEQERPATALRAAGIDPLEVRLVVNTHLHWDHSSNNDLFPNAEIVVQRRELDYARQPLPWSAAAYEQALGPKASWRSSEGRFRLIDGDADLAPGLSAVALPGHTPGSQGVLVEGGADRFLIAGDCIGLYENWAGDDQADHIPSGQFINLIEYDASFRKIEALGCEVVPSHDRLVLEQDCFS